MAKLRRDLQSEGRIKSKDVGKRIKKNDQAKESIPNISAKKWETHKAVIPVACGIIFFSRKKRKLFTYYVYRESVQMTRNLPSFHKKWVVYNTKKQMTCFLGSGKASSSPISQFILKTEAGEIERVSTICSIRITTTSITTQNPFIGLFLCLSVL